MAFGRLRGPWAGRIACSSAVVASVLALSSTPASAEVRNVALPVVAINYKFPTVPKKLPEGGYRVRFFNASDEPHVFIAVNLGAQCSGTVSTIAKAKAFLDTIDSEEAFAEACPGGSLAGDIFAEPLGRDRGPLNLEAGRTLYFCPIPTEGGTPHYKLGMVGLIDVVETPTP